MGVRDTLTELWQLVESVPSGKVIGYGQLGRMMSRPVSGVLIGKWMASAPTEVPWWRVIGADGNLPIARRGPEFALEQRARLEREGVVLEGNKVPQSYFVTGEDWLS